MLPEATGPLRQQQPQDLARDASASSDISTAASLTSMASSACDNACRSADVSPCESPSNANITYLPYCPTADLPAKAESRLIHSAPLSHESKARIAVVQAFAESPAKMMGTYCVKRIIGFGSNGVVLAASFKKSPVAIKIIYKAQAAVTHTGLAAEVEAAKYLASSSSESSSHLLKYVDDWKDARHFYLVTELFGSDWLASSPTEKLCPLNFKAIYANAVATICLPFHSGSSDLWAWAYAHRALVWESTQHRHTFLPINPIKRLIRQIAVALAQIHVRGFYHGDVKIENVLVQAGHSGTPRGGDDLPQVRLADYGHANHVSCGMKVYGTREVSPPEFLRGSPYSWNDGRAADIFALGMVMYKLLHESGELPRIVQVAKSGVISYDALLKEDSGFLPLDGLRDVDEVAISLLDGMCMVDPARRLTVQHVLAHPWFSE
ncbi:Serine/threonine-protein kinase 33 [Entophlyctis luteolus]|nr:Serine/threonine-protein kinase 33 [Entophlyctis luteolus]KAJ3357295.1 Serine/threonine-protein kinase 33 [Entophlyctis luteolus]KAJ3394397.1 Serine/threonine-protein kinase 33 [Entophlyctis sp. JEL0112]